MIKNYFEVKKADGKILRGIITRPDSNQVLPAIIYSHGFTGNKLESHGLFRKIADNLVNENIISIRFDFMGSGESDGEFSEMTISTEVEDLLEIYNYINSLPYVDSSKIGLLGFSLGGAISIIVAAKLKGKIDKLILLAPATNLFGSFGRELHEQKLVKYIEEGTIDLYGNVISKQLIDEAFDVNVFDYASKISTKTLIIHGSNDQAVLPLSSLKLLDILKGKKYLNWIENADHCFSSSHFEEQVISRINYFLN